MEVFLTLVVLGVWAFAIWVGVIAVRFLRSGRKAFDRYVAVTFLDRRRVDAMLEGDQEPASPANHRR